MLLLEPFRSFIREQRSWFIQLSISVASYPSHRNWQPILNVLKSDIDDEITVYWLSGCIAKKYCNQNNYMYEFFWLVMHNVPSNYEVFFSRLGGLSPPWRHIGAAYSWYCRRADLGLKRHSLVYWHFYLDDNWITKPSPRPRLLMYRLRSRFSFRSITLFASHHQLIYSRRLLSSHVSELINLVAAYIFASVYHKARYSFVKKRPSTTFGNTWPAKKPD